MGNHGSTPPYYARPVQVTPVSGSSRSMPDKLVFYDDTPVKQKPKPKTRSSEQYPKYIKIINPTTGSGAPQRQESIQQRSAQQRLYPQLDPYNGRLSENSNMVLLEPVPYQRRSSGLYNNYNQQIPQPLYLQRSHSYDGQRRSVANFPIQRNNSYSYYNSHLHAYDERNPRMMNAYDDSVLLSKNRGTNNMYRNFERFKGTSASNSSKSRASPSLSKKSSDSEMLLSRELEVATVKQFQDDTGATVRIVKPIGERSRIAYTKPDTISNFVIVESNMNTPIASPIPPEKEEEKEEVQVDETKEEEEVKEKIEEEEKPKEEEEVKEKIEEEEKPKELVGEKETSVLATSSTQTKKLRKVTYRDNKSFKLRQQLSKAN